VLSATPLASFDEEKCKYCGRYGCTDRGYSLAALSPDVVVAEAKWSQEINASLARLFDANKEEYPLCYVEYHEPQCARKLKKSNAESLLDKIKTCGPDCQLNRACLALGGIWNTRTTDYHCPFRNEVLSICQQNIRLDNTALVCKADDIYGMAECAFHEGAYSQCYKRKDGEPCYDLNRKFGVTDSDSLLMLSHRFSFSDCRFCDVGTCRNEKSMYYEGICSAKGLMAPCEHYESVSPDHAYTEGVCTYVNSFDGKDDRKIFNTSSYAAPLSKIQRFTLCTACRISHSIAKATGLKCNGVRRAAKNPFLNDTNPLHDNAIQVNYMYLSHPEDVARYNPEIIAQAVYDALSLTCRGVGCEEIEDCKLCKE